MKMSYLCTTAVHDLCVGANAMGVCGCPCHHDEARSNAMAEDRRRYRSERSGMSKTETAEWYERQAAMGDVPAEWSINPTEHKTGDLIRFTQGGTGYGVMA